MTTDQPGSISIDDLTLRFSKQDVDEAYDRGLAEGRRQRDAEYDVKLGGNGTTPPPVEMVYGYNVGLAEGRRQATEGLPSADDLARAFHEAYECLAPQHGYETREASAKPWEDVPANNRALMIATCAAIRFRLVGPWGPESSPEDVADTQCPRCGGPALQHWADASTPAEPFALVPARIECRDGCGTDVRAEPASGGVVEPSPLTAEEATPEPCDRTDLPEVSDMRCAGCGAEAGQHPAWRKRHRRHDPGALIEEPGLYPKVHDPADERRADDAHMAAGEAWMEHDAEQGEGGAR